MNTTIILLILFSYLIGSIPTGYLIAKHTMHIDIREHGSGNPGAANVYRIVGKWAGVCTFLIDAIKGYVPVLLARHFCPDIYAIAIVCGVVAILGHMWTIYLKFRGGKGVATSAGVFLALAPVPTVLAFLTFVALVAKWGRISIGSIFACVVLPVASWCMSYPLAEKIMATAVGALVIYKHIPNIKRLLAQNELKFEDGAKKRKAHENK
ncbi:MAG: glycerol-3-phosphate 1-O-acyltransferase PlsY [Elusimicrobiaceae bacterium]|nr:glycerol-3-phosphate 1-O-acyltransferase PlsY [Elusimicrobiaceae bacterium]